jgi:predicted RNA-binding Zn-ribbon protein involved in translation (DUF1610 family)
VPIQVTCPSCKGSFNAPDNAAGKRAKCPTCGGVIQIPTPAAEEILEAEPEPVSPYTDDDFAVEAPPPLPAADDTKPCPMCGERIQRNAIKCRHCGEVFDPLLRAQEKKHLTSSGGEEDLSALEWILCILCSTIGCIVGIVYLVQGKPKGKKMILVSICASIIFGIINVIIESMQQ